MRAVSKDQTDEHRYDDLLLMEHHTSKNHPQMSMEQRASQFSPFSALNGYEESIDEAERITSQMIDLSEDEKEGIDQELKKIQMHIKEHPQVKLVYFEEDPLKQGGAYKEITQHVKKIELGRIFLEKIVVDLQQIISIHIKNREI